MDAFVTVRYKLSHLCNEEDLVSCGITFRQMVEYLIEEEGLWGMTDDDSEEILSIEIA